MPLSRWVICHMVPMWEYCTLMILFQFQAVIQKSSFVYWTLSWIGIRRLRWFSGEGNYKDKHNGQRLCFRRTHFLLEKTCRFLLPPILSIYFVLTYHKSNFYLYNTWWFTKHYNSHLWLHFVFKIGLQPASCWCWRPNTLILLMLKTKHTYFWHTLRRN